MQPKRQSKYTPPRPRRGQQTPQAPVDLGSTTRTRKRKALEEIPRDEPDTEKDAAAPKSPATSDKAEEPEPTPEAKNDETDKKEEENERAQDAGSEFTFKKLLDHRWEGDSILVYVEWDNGDHTWEPEASLHTDAPQTLLKYWAQQPGGRPENPGRPGFYEIHAIRKHSRDRKRLFVEWVGYGPKDRTWEPAGMVEEAAPAIWTEYWGSLPRPKRRKRTS